jgi:hypothetical protein
LLLEMLDGVVHQTVVVAVAVVCLGVDGDGRATVDCGGGAWE